MAGRPNTAWRKTMIEKLGSEEALTEWHRTIGAVGGRKGTTGGYAYAKKHYSEDDPRHPKNSGIKGGTISRKTKKHEPSNIH